MSEMGYDFGRQPTGDEPGEDETEIDVLDNEDFGEDDLIGDEDPEGGEETF